MTDIFGKKCTKKRYYPKNRAKLKNLNDVGSKMI